MFCAAVLFYFLVLLDLFIYLFIGSLYGVIKQN